MQDAADVMLAETFQFPGPTDRVMLPPQPSRNMSSEGRKVSFGQPLQLIDSNEVLPYKGKGKGRARDFDLFNMNERMFNAWEEANMGGAGGFDVPAGTNVLGYQIPQFDGPGQFTFIPGQLEASQPTIHTRSQSQIQMQGVQAGTADYQGVQGVINPSVSQLLAQATQQEQAPLPQWPGHAHQLPLQQAYQPPPGFPQQPQFTGQTFFPGSEIRLPQLDGSQQTNTGLQPLPSSVEIPLRIGYHFQPGRGFVCHVCSGCVAQPGMHPFEGQNRWCWADGPGMRADDEANVHRRPKRARMELYIP